MNAEVISIQELIEQLFPIHRSQTGEGVRATFELLKSCGLPLEVYEVPSGKQVFDWQVPLEWRINDAFIKDANGNRIIDYRDSNLHILNGSIPVDCEMSFEELKPFLFKDTNNPDAIPYRTAFFKDTWGFCVNQKQYSDLESNDSDFQVVIDSEFFDGALAYAEACLPGTSDRTVVIWTHTCHPSLANDNISGLAASVSLFRILASVERKYSYRFVFAPATIGAITWLAENEMQLDQIDFGLVICLLGNDGPFTFKRSRYENHLIDRCLEQIASESEPAVRVIPFSPTGYDERQFGSPGINLPFARITRTEPGRFTEYHTSDDCLSFISEFRILQSVDMIYSVVKAAEENCVPISSSPKCEPRLGQRGLFTSYGDSNADSIHQQAILWTLNLADGQHDALAISERSSIPISETRRAIDLLAEHGLIEIREVY